MPTAAVPRLTRADARLGPWSARGPDGHGERRQAVAGRSVAGAVLHLCSIGMADPVIAVTGATGAVGGRVAARLAEAGAHQRLIVRDAARAPTHAGAEVRQVPGYAAGAEMRVALHGVDTLFLVPGEEAHDRVDQHRTAIDAAVAAGVRHIVYLSFFAAAPDATFTLARDHWHTEEHVRAGPSAWTFLRMNLYIDFLPAMVLPDGVMRGPAGDGRVSAILRDDVAAAASVVLTTTGHEARAYDLTGRESFSLAQAAELMTRLTGRRIRFEDESDEEAFASRAGYGAPDYMVRGWVSTYQAIRDGSLERVRPDFGELVGREPATLAEYLQEHPRALDHVTR